MTGGILRSLAVEFSCTTEVTLGINQISGDCDGKDGFVACFSVPENAVSGTDVGTLSASDPDRNDVIEFFLAQGNLQALYNNKVPYLE